jgi:Icc-related predicted phosphoesterase
MAKTTIYFATDVHGSEKCFSKFINAAKHYGVDTLILGGDVCGKVMVPVVDMGAGRYAAHHLGADVTVEGEPALAELLKSIRYGGFYPYLTDREEVEQLRSDQALRDRVFDALLGETLERWVHMAEERLSGTNVRMYMMLGNDDEPDVARYLEGSSVVVAAGERVCELADGISMLSVGYSNRTPFNSPRELDEDELYERIETLARGLADPQRSVFNLHCPPIKSGLDEAPKLDAELRPVTTMAAGGVATAAVGSIATRKAIEQFQPFVGLHGHIHESTGMRKIGRTSCFNPGSEYGSGILRGVVLALDAKRGLKDYMFSTG